MNAINNSSNRSLADAACSCGVELEINYISHRFRLSLVQLRNQPKKIWHRQNVCFYFLEREMTRFRFETERFLFELIICTAISFRNANIYIYKSVGDEINRVELSNAHTHSGVL